MAKQTILTGTVPDDGTGDTLRDSFVKVNANFTELYNHVANTDVHGSGGGDFTITTASASGGGALAYTSSSSTFTFTPASVPSSILNLGISDGNANEVLTTDGNGSFSFAAVEGLKTRQSLTGSTASLANDATGNVDITGYKAYALLSIQTDRAAWVRVYTHAAARTADASRGQLEDPAPDAGVIAEVITTGAATIQISPGALGYSFESTPGTTIPIAVTNLSGATAAVAVTLTALQLEG